MPIKTELTIIQKNILNLLMEGHQYKEIAFILNYSLPHISLSARFLYAKLGAKSPTHAVVIALRRDIINLNHRKTQLEDN